NNLLANIWSTSPSPVPTYIRSGSVGSIAIAPQQLLVAAKAVGSKSKPSIVDFQDAPESSDRQTPPSAEATYIGEPPGAIEIRDTRPATGGLPVACPLRTTEGPIGTQFL